MLNVKLKEKDQECRLSVLKIKELKRAVRHNQLKPLPKVPHRNDEDKKSHDTEISNFRHESAESKPKKKKQSLYKMKSMLKVLLSVETLI